MAVVLTGCGTTQPAKFLDDDPDLEEAADDVKESKLDYETCLKDQEDGAEVDCDYWKDMYEEDQLAYDQLLKARKAKGR